MWTSWYTVRIKVINDTITLKWSKPEYIGLYPLRHYRVYYRSTTDSPGKRVMENTEGPVEGMVVKDLYDKGSAFIFTVVAINEIGAGLESKESSVINLPSTKHGMMTDKQLAPLSTSKDSLCHYKL